MLPSETVATLSWLKVRIRSGFSLLESVLKVHSGLFLKVGVVEALDQLIIVLVFDVLDHEIDGLEGLVTQVTDIFLSFLDFAAFGEAILILHLDK